MAFFSGSAEEMLKKYGQKVPEQKPMSSLEEAQASKAKLEAEKVCTDEHCTEDHTHGHSHGHGETCTEDHSHGHKHEAPAPDAHGHGHGGTCTEDRGHGGHDHKEKPDHAHGHGHKEEQAHHEGCSGDHGHSESGHAHEKSAHEHGHEHGEGCGHAEEHPIAAAIKAALDCDHVEVAAEGSGCGQKVQAVVVSSAFAGMPLLKQHKLVMKGAEAEIAKVHAFSLKTYTPAKWAAKK